MRREHASRGSGRDDAAGEQRVEEPVDVVDRRREVGHARGVAHVKPGGVAEAGRGQDVARGAAGDDGGGIVMTRVRQARAVDHLLPDELVDVRVAHALDQRGQQVVVRIGRARPRARSRGERFLQNDRGQLLCASRHRNGADEFRDLSDVPDA